MIIEAITAYTAVKITWETLEILHLLHVGHETGKHGYKAGSFITNALQQRLQEIEIDDLSHIIYSGVDPNGICLWKENSNTFSGSNQLVHYFSPKKEEDSKTKAWLYARDECRVNRAALFSICFLMLSNRFYYSRLKLIFQYKLFLEITSN